VSVVTEAAGQEAVLKQLGISLFACRSPFMPTLREAGTLERLGGQFGHKVEGADLVDWAIRTHGDQDQTGGRMLSPREYFRSG
jgi:hypothetical protein